MSEISMFAPYSQRENIVTSNTMLLLKTIYNDSILVFNSLISRLVGQDVNFGLQFEQQVSFQASAGNRISDGLIEQKSISIYVETKTTDWFYEEQIKNYLGFMKERSSSVDQQILILLSNFDSKSRLEKDILDKLPENIPAVALVSFEELLYAVKEEVKSSDGVIQVMIADYENFLSKEGLLPIWASTLEIIPMGNTLEANKKFCCYSCPNNRKHSRAKYLGFYAQKNVDTVAEIDAVLELPSKDRQDWAIKWNNSKEEEETLKDRAEAIISNPEYYGHHDMENGGGVLLFLLNNMQTSVNFRKESFGGIMGRFYMKFGGIKNMEELLSKIQDRKWRSATEFVGGMKD